MDSGNSESMQSSSGGDDEYDSRAESISAFLNTNHPLPSPLPPPLIQRHQQNRPPSAIFDPLSNFFDPSSPRSFSDTNSANLEAMWSRTLRYNQNSEDLSGLVPSSNSSLAFTVDEDLPGNKSKNGDNPFTSDQSKKDVRVNNGKTSKKRSRASRRAPTTVLSTDTSNFRQMVQEFTGIPAPPFSPSSFSRARLDLFGTSSSSTLRSGNLEPAPPSFLLRPFPQRAPVINIPSANASMGGIIASTATANPPMQNLALNFQPLFQSPARYPLANFPISGSKPQVSPAMPQENTHLKTGILEELGLTHNHRGLSGFLNTQSPNIVSSSTEKTIRPPANWKDADQPLLRSVKGDERNAKIRYSASPSEFHADKAPVRSEGMVESWIYSSD